MWNLIVSVPDHCLSFYFQLTLSQIDKLPILSNIDDCEKWNHVIIPNAVIGSCKLCVIDIVCCWSSAVDISAEQVLPGRYCPGNFWFSKVFVLRGLCRSLGFQRVMLKFHRECWYPMKSHSKALVFFAVSKQFPVVYSADRGRTETSQLRYTKPCAVCLTSCH